MQVMNGKSYPKVFTLDSTNVWSVFLGIRAVMSAVITFNASLVNEITVNLRVRWFSQYWIFLVMQDCMLYTHGNKLGNTCNNVTTNFGLFISFFVKIMKNVLTIC